MAIERTHHPVMMFLEKTKASAQFMKEAEHVMPGGVTANIKHFAPYPIVMKKGSGAYLTDVDGNVYIDYLLAYGALMLGHGHQAIQQAIMEQLQQDGTVLFGAPHELEVTMGKRLQSLYPSMERLRYTNSGTEATLLAIRLAAAYTEKFKIAKFEGHYHGGYNQVLYSVNPSIEAAGPADEPVALPESMGMTDGEQRDTIILPFNDLDACEKILRKHKDEIGAVILEPMQGGFIPATESFIKGLRAVTKELEMVLIFDEVKTGFRVGLGGAQAIYGVRPDLTALGKVVGGGFPVGVVGGAKDIMMTSAPRASADVFDSSQSAKSGAKEVLFHSGTYNGHPMILAAGLKTIMTLEEKITSVFSITDTLKEGLEALFSARGIPMKAVGSGSIFSVVLTDREILNYRDLQRADLSTRKMIDMNLLSEGIYTKPLNRYSLSTAHTSNEIEQTLDAYDRVLTKLFGGATS
ncbi:aspartate aminotransferase family protein [Halalkalibacterium ligniniphilum]|uniref:aspartate aminotransferase family protein n=1 Tax=Halalkalibacterium ligniniphilum TaxID=1134413 RepID=UPI00034A9AE4|nr:aspartate aminotransferase family protein [Halalkalibacterium ligniniphilum]